MAKKEKTVPHFTVEIERQDDDNVVVLFNAFGRTIGEINFYSMTDDTEALKQYMLAYRPYDGGEFDEDTDPIIIEEGHADEGMIQRAK